jgi:hypothetical protein
MSRAKQASKRKTQTKVVTVLGVAGALSLASGASGAAVNPPEDTLTANTRGRRGLGPLRLLRVT